MEIYIEDMVKGCVLQIVGVEENAILSAGDPRSLIIEEGAEAAKGEETGKSTSSLEVMFKSETKKDEKEKGPSGIDTTLSLVKRYIDRVYGEIISKKDELYANLSTPLLRDPLEILCHL